MDKDIALSIQNVDKIYERRKLPPVHAVKNLSMDVLKGEVVALLGSSGCGKTSTLRMIAGFEEVSAGTLTLAGRRIERLPPSARNVAMAFEGYSLYPPLLVRDNIGFALKAQRLSREAVADKVAEIARLIEIEPILDRYPSSISGGQQQRASLARALVRPADLYLLDEPMGQLEPQLRAVLRGRIKRLLNENGMTAIFVTHDQTEANALADRIAVMEGGVLQQFATPKDLKDRPANLFVATFIGEPPMNVFEAAVDRSGGGLVYRIANGPSIDAGVHASNPATNTALGARQTVTIGIRPHKVRIGEGALNARLVSNQWLGDQSHLALSVADRVVVGVSHDRVAAARGEEVAYDIRAADLHVFDTATGNALVHGTHAA